MQIREEHLSGTQHGAFVRLRLLHLHDEFRALEGRGRGRRNLSAHRLIVRIGDANSPASAALYQYFVARLGELAYALGDEPHPVLLDLDLSRHTYSHCTLPVFYC